MLVAELQIYDHIYWHIYTHMQYNIAVMEKTSDEYAFP